MSPHAIFKYLNNNLNEKQICLRCDDENCMYMVEKIYIGNAGELCFMYFVRNQLFLICADYARKICM